MLFIFTWSRQKTWIASELYRNLYTHFFLEMFSSHYMNSFSVFLFICSFSFCNDDCLTYLMSIYSSTYKSPTLPLLIKAQRKYLFLILKNTLKAVEITVASQMQSNAKLLFEKDSEMYCFFLDHVRFVIKVEIAL